MESDLWSYGLTEQVAASATERCVDDRVLGRVVTQDRGSVLIATDSGERRTDVDVNAADVPVVGDWVIADEHKIVEILERTSLLRRAAAMSDSEQLIAANVDVIAIVCGVDRPVKLHRIERAVVQAWDAGATPLIVLTKTDVDVDWESIVAELRDAAPATECFTVSVRQVAGLDVLRTRLAGCTTVMIGESGAGKSTLVNALAGGELMLTQPVREGDNKGRHTTTRRELHVLQDGIVLIDTPGVRSLGLWTDAASIDAAFEDVQEFASQCRFRDCAHEAEPGCAVKAAVDADLLSANRLASWRAFRSEAESLALRQQEHERRASERKFGKTVDEALRLKGKK